jgi:hypothetical protein
MQAVSERLALLDERVRGFQESMAKAITEQATAHAVLAQWMKDWTAEVAAWRAGMDRRLAALETRQEQMTQEADRARGALRVAMWVFGTAVTLATGISSGLMVKVFGEALAKVTR